MCDMLRDVTDGKKWHVHLAVVVQWLKLWVDYQVVNLKFQACTVWLLSKALSP